MTGQGESFWPEEPPERWGLEWQDPEPPRSRVEPIVPDEILDELRANPKRWARVRVYRAPSTASSVVSLIRRDRRPDLPAAEWDVMARRGIDGSALFLRFIGETPDSEATER